MKIEYFTKEQLKSKSKNELVRMYLKVTDLVNKSYADYEEVVHCKDCKHRDPEDKKCDCGHGIVWQLPRPDDWYCADGERRTE